VRAKRVGGQGIQIRNRLRADWNADADPQTIADAEVFTGPKSFVVAKGIRSAEGDARKIVISIGNSVELILPA